MHSDGETLEPIIDPALPIIDPHHHLWDQTPFLDYMRPATYGWQKVMIRAARYMVDDLKADLLESGHMIEASVFVDCGSFYRADGPEELRAVGETEFVNGAAAIFASRHYGAVRGCAGIVGHADLTRGDGVEAVLEAHITAGGGRFRGIRQSASHDPDLTVLGPLNAAEPGLYRSDRFRDGFAHLARLGLSFDAWVVEPQLPDVIDLARAFPDTSIILDHLGSPLGVGGYAGRREERFPIWKRSLQLLAEQPNVTLKLGGLGMDLTGLPSFLAAERATSEILAEQWRPWVETGIEIFGPERCMFESNFPSESGTADYRTLWNTFKRIVSGASASEKAALFRNTAARIYRL